MRQLLLDYLMKRFLDEGYMIEIRYIADYNNWMLYNRRVYDSPFLLNEAFRNILRHTPYKSQDLRIKKVYTLKT